MENKIKEMVLEVDKLNKQCENKEKELLESLVNHFQIPLSLCKSEDDIKSIKKSVSELIPTDCLAKDLMFHKINQKLREVKNAK